MHWLQGPSVTVRIVLGPSSGPEYTKNQQSCDEDTYHVLSDSSFYIQMYWSNRLHLWASILASFPGSPHVQMKNQKERVGSNCWKQLPKSVLEPFCIFVFIVYLCIELYHDSEGVTRFGVPSHQLFVQIPISIFHSHSHSHSHSHPISHSTCFSSSLM